MSRYTISDSNLNNTNSFNVWNNYTVTDDRSRLLNWLSPLEPRLRHRDIQERRVNNVGEWLVQSKEFRSWRDRSREGEGDKAVLFCYGDPGVGKTFISSLAVDRLCDWARGQNITVTCFYFEFAARKEQSATSMLGSLLKQTVSGMENIPEEISRAFQDQGRAIGGRGPQLPDIVKMLQTITSAQRIFICIDALDECAPLQRVKLLGSLQQLLDKSPNTRVFLAGRPHIQAEIEKRLSGRVVSVSVGPRKGDINRYLHARLGEDETPDAMDESLEADILKKIPENISEMFLLVSLNIDAILQEPTIHQRRERLSRMADGSGLGDAYGATIERIKAQGGGKSRLGMAALLWISHAERPLQADELCQALAVELGSTDFNPSNTPSMSTLVSCCQGLITVDKEASTVRLIHFTLQEYLSAHPNIFSRPHSIMAEICLTFLNSRRVKAVSADPFPATRNTPFLGYCSVYWGVHAKRDLSDCARSLALDLFLEYDGHISTKFLSGQMEHLYLEDSDTCSPFSGLHCASFFGIIEVVAALVEMKCYDINEEDFLGRTPLAWAARNGHDEVVKILLGREEVNPDKQDNFGRTPLLLAVSGGNEEAVKMLLRRKEVNPDKSGNGGKTPLSYAATWGHEGVVKILLGQQEVNPDKPDNYGRTALSYAASYGHEGVVRTLLGREDVNPEKPDNGGQTPLSYAAWSGHEGVVKILLGLEETDPDKPGNYGRIPLSFAAEGGHEGVVRILLRRGGVNPDKPDIAGQTPLSHAASHGHEGVVKILLGREEVDPNKPDTDGQTPLSHAAWFGREGVTKILLGREEVSPDKPDNFGRTPLLYASWFGHEGVVKILLGREDVNPDNPDNNGQSPLSYAASDGHEGVVRTLLRREDVNPNKPDNDGKTPLLLAASGGHEEVVTILLGWEGVNPDGPDNYGGTPLSLATQRGHKRVAALLQSRNAIPPRPI